MSGPLSLPDRIALVHEWFTPRSVGGSEQVVQALDQFLNADLFALVDGESTRPSSWLYGRRVRTSWVQRLPWGVSHVQQYLPLLPVAIEHLDLADYPLVLSSSHLVAKGVLTGPDQCHVSYVHTPARYAWDQMQAYLRRSTLARSPLGPLIRWQLHRLRQWDSLSAQRVDRLVANSRFTASRIWRCWRRRAAVVHPPVAVDRYAPQGDRDDFYLSLCRLVPYKRVDLVVEACNRAGLPLVVAGDGPERRRLEALAGPTVRVIGHCSQEEARRLMGSCRAYVYAGLEDFGIAPVEAMAAGAPVIALARGGLLDTVRCLARGDVHPTGLLFPEQSAESLCEALEWFEARAGWRDLPPDGQREWAEQFSEDRFRRRMQTLLEATWSQHRRRQRRTHTPLPVPLD
ncbi:glycosyltransferase family 4 protein [Synechococcus sp. RSCCF101]|uniref:glycosyltransferase n=1 Tax=Synechococcus sp. RSCCF101 TaxID=2511069 RepID=UPI0012489624|nr:glycosyltransferase [Synechococcus sp. RSCCF101]QEY33232.1 glycosyltransferase family 4 protein [Synechococcus sp. RSCCF101]